MPPPPTATPIPTTTACTIEFSDVPVGSDFYTYIHCLACLGIVSGYEDGTFLPDNNVTRGQLAKIVSNSAGWDDTIAPSMQTFEDVPFGSTFWEYIERMAMRGVIGGYACGGSGEPCGTPALPYYRPGNPATRGQISKIVVISADLPIDTTGGPHFNDVPSGSTFYDWVETLFNADAITGYPDGSFRPNNNATRAQTAKIDSIVFFPDCAVSSR